MRDASKKISDIFTATQHVLGPGAWKRMLDMCGHGIDAELFVERISELQKDHLIPDFLPELTMVEWTYHAVCQTKIKLPNRVEKYVLNPTLEAIQCRWRLSFLLGSEKPRIIPEPGDEYIFIWRCPGNNKVRLMAATDEDLLAVKIVAEDMSPLIIASQGELTVGQVEELLKKSARKGLILSPPTKIIRDPKRFKSSKKIPKKFLVAPVFTIQWHITHVCDLHCKHCYDRSKRSPLTLDQGLMILKDYHLFCRDRHVSGHVCFTGGNPFLYPQFPDLYQSAKDHGFSVSILGNPVQRKKLENLIAIQKPRYFQVSLEGLPKHNDYIRGRGNYFAVIDFLGVLRDLKVPSAVMLTLTKDNVDQVLPLAEKLRGHTDRFTFNRLSMVGEGANMMLPSKKVFKDFLNAYAEAAKRNPILNMKDNLINILHYEKGESLFGGCTGYGCGAAFSFLAVLPDGEVHACRKFPSPLGNVIQKGFSEIYDSEQGEQYRLGTSACNGCSLKPVCGSCLAVSHGYGLDIFTEKDPHCFLES